MSTKRPPPMVNLSSQKMGIHEWSYDNDISNDLRYKVPHAPHRKDAEECASWKWSWASTSSRPSWKPSAA